MKSTCNKERYGNSQPRQLGIVTGAAKLGLETFAHQLDKKCPLPLDGQTGSVPGRLAQSLVSRMQDTVGLTHPLGGAHLQRKQSTAAYAATQPAFCSCLAIQSYLNGEEF